MFISNIKSLFSVLVLIFFFNVITGKEIDTHKYYQEQVYLHLGRDTYIAGEKIWFKAYCKNISNPELPALSKVIYVELLNVRNGHVIGQILKSDNGSSESCIDIPDTLSSGIYSIKGYTQWMKNFSSESFYSQQLFIYNYYNESSEKKYEVLKIDNGPKIFIEGNKLIDGITSKIAVCFSEYIGKEVPMKIIDSATSHITKEFSLNTGGVGYFEFTPDFGSTYLCKLADSLSNFEFKLPAISNDGFKINILSIDEANLNLQIRRANVIDQKLELSVINENDVLDQKSLTGSMLNSEISLTYIGAKTPILEVVLKDTYGKVLATNTVQIQPLSAIQLQSLKKVYSSGEKVDCNLLFQSSDTSNILNASVSVHKTGPSLNNQRTNNLLGTYHNLNYCTSVLDKNADVLLPVYNPNGIITSKVEIANLSKETILPVEDLGIVYSGFVVDINTNQLAPGIEVLYSVKDTIPNIQSAITDENGHFALLTNYQGNPQTFITLHKDQIPVTDQYKYIIENKFYYQTKPLINSLTLHKADSSFISDIEVEAQRVFIQKAFARRSRHDEENTYFTNVKPVYFTNSMITVIIDDFFDMPNFEEIAREVIPRVQYKKSKNECILSVITSRPESRSNYPLVLLNGVTVDDKCELYNLNSELIKKILIQHEPRVVGNLNYNGLVSIITNPDKKLKNFKANSENLVNLPYYKICPAYNDVDLSKTLNSDNLPDFRNQLYWRSFSIKGGSTQQIQLVTSDEEGEYIIDIIGYTDKGVSVKHQETFTVISKQ